MEFDKGLGEELFVGYFELINLKLKLNFVVKMIQKIIRPFHVNPSYVSRDFASMLNFTFYDKIKSTAQGTKNGKWQLVTS